jgi:multidrug efflux system membrane fusion protein
VYIVKADGTAELRPVTVGTAFGRRQVIEKGVEPGETVVTDGHLRLSPGAKVKLVDAEKLGAGKS